LVDLRQLDPQGPVPNRMDDWVQSAFASQPLLEQARRLIISVRTLLRFASARLTAI
jgi:hypothetical protein